MDDLISIGQFAAITWLSPKALRLYQAQGLLEPTHVDGDSGYRYYAPDQVAVARRIAVLRRAGIPLAEIARFVAAPSPEHVRRWRADLEAEVAERRRLLEHLTHLDDLEEVPQMPDPTPVRLHRAVPVLASLDIEATQRFYVERLGFSAGARYPDYGIVRRDGVEIHFWLTDDEDIPKATSCRVDVESIGALYDEMQAAGVVHPHAPLREQPWGFSEFGVLDGDGNLIKFGQRS